MHLSSRILLIWIRISNFNEIRDNGQPLGHVVANHGRLQDVI
jgi:hypothetical protein